MKCEKCGKQLEYVEVNMFNHDGSDDWYDVEIDMDYGIAYINILPNWTGNDLSEEEMTETIRCPHCHKYPFVDKEIHADDYVNVTMFPSGTTQF